MMHRGTMRESRNLRQKREPSSSERKLRRHRNKMRIWRRAVRRLAQAQLAAA